MDFLDAVSSLLGKRRAESTGIQQPTNVHLVTMEAVEASSDGTVLVDPGGDVISPDGSQYVEIQTVGSVQEGDEVAVALVGEPGGAMDVMAIGTVGEGDHQNELIASASEAAQTAWEYAGQANDAAVAAQGSADAAAESARTANQNATKAIGDAAAASAAATEAQDSADSAAASAQTANENATKAIEDAGAASDAAQAAQGSADSAAESARTAQQTAEAAQRSANTAQGAANAAQQSANAANAHATAALNSLSTVEDVVDTLTWITEHGTMARTTDTAVDPSKVYFVRDNNGDYTVGGNRYSIVQEPAASGLSGYYELTIDKSVENYIATHLSVTSEGLWLTPTQSGGYRVLVATGGAGKTYPTAGTYIIDGSGRTMAQFTGTGISFADDRTFYIGDESAYIFFDGNGHINIGGSNVTIGGSTTLAELLAKYDATITSDDISVSKTGGTATITVGGDTVTISDGAAGAQGPKGDTGDQGPQGPKGNDGVSVTGVEHQYYLSTSSTSQTGGSWTVKPAAYVKGRYYWERWKVSFSSGNPTYTTATLAEEVTSAWTSISNNASAIALKANSSDVYTKTAVDGKITQEVTDLNAAITAKANEITSTVSQTYTTKQEFADLEVGGRNLLKYSRDYSQGYGGSKTGAFDDIDGTYQQCAVWKHTKSQNSSYEEALSTDANRVSLWTVGPDEDYVLSFWAKASAPLQISSFFYNGNNNTCDKVETSTGWSGTNSDGNSLHAISTEWARHWVHWHFNSNTDPTIRKNLIIARMQNDVTGTVWIAGPKLEKGARATDWTPAPEDAEERVTNAETKIEQNATAIALRATKTDVYQGAQPNLVPMFSMDFDDVYDATSNPDGYWNVLDSSRITQGENGWAHISSSVGGTTRYSVNPDFGGEIKPSTLYTALVEIKNLTSTGTVQFVPNINGQWSQSSYFDAPTYFYPENGSKYITLSSNSSFDSATTMLYGYFYLSGTSPSVECDVRISLYEGEYSGPYKPYSGKYLYATQGDYAELKVTTDGITSTVSKISGIKYLEAASAGWAFSAIKSWCVEGTTDSWSVRSTENVRVGDTVYIKGYDVTRKCTVYIKGTVNAVASSINQSAESVKIQASKVEIDGTAIFTAISGDVDNAITDKGYATTTQAQGYATTAENNAKAAIPSDISELNNDSGYITSTDVPTKVSDLTNDANYATTTQAQGYATTAKTEAISAAATDATSKANAVQANLDNLEIGGRNYVLNSSGTLVSGLGSAAGSRKEYQVLNVGQSYMDIPHGTQVTISFDLYMTVNTANPELLVYNTNYRGPKAFSQLSDATGETTGVRKKFTSAAGSVIDERVSVTGYINDRTSPSISDNFLEFYSGYGTSNWFSISNLKLEIGNKATDWSPAPEDSLAEEQYIYISSASGTTSINKNTTWVTQSSDVQNVWTTKRPTYNSSNPVLFVAKQSKTVGGSVSCTTPVKDDTTTVIDGAHITTGTIDTNRLNADTIKSNIVQTTDLSATQITSGDISADRIKANVIGAINSLTAGQIDAARINASQLTIGQSQVTNLTSALNAKANSSNVYTKNETDAAITAIPSYVVKTSNYVYTYDQWKTYAAEGYTDSWTTITGVKVGDTVLIKGTVRDTQESIYVLVTVNAVSSNSGAITNATSHGLVDQNALSRLSVGGRNLLTNTKANWKTAGLGNGVYASSGNQICPTNGSQGTNFKIPIEPNTPYIVQGWSELTDYPTLYVGVHQLDENLTFLNDSTWKQITDTGYSFTSLSNAAYVRVTFREQTYSASGAAAVVSAMGDSVRIKFEKGNKATDWSPAPEDVEADISEAAQTATNYITTIDANNGIKIANTSPSSATTYLHLASSFLDFIRGGVSMLKAWVDGTTAKIRVGAESGFNTLTDDEGIKLMEGTDLAAQFTKNVITLCGGAGKISAGSGGAISIIGKQPKLIGKTSDDTSTAMFSVGTYNGTNYADISAWTDDSNVGIQLFPVIDGIYSVPTISIEADGSDVDFAVTDLINAIPVTLYDNDSASASAATTLSESAANFRRLTIMYRDQDNTYSSVDVWNPNGKRVSLDLTWINGSSTQQMYQRVRWVTISGTTISTSKDSSDSKYRTGQVRLGGSYSVTNSDYISIVHVIGYR